MPITLQQQRKKKFSSSKFISWVSATLILIFVWSCITTFISNSMLHVCVTSPRKLNHKQVLYCLSAGHNASATTTTSSSSQNFLASRTAFITTTSPFFHPVKITRALTTSGKSIIKRVFTTTTTSVIRSSPFLEVNSAAFSYPPDAIKTKVNSFSSINNSSAAAAAPPPSSIVVISEKIDKEDEPREDVEEKLQILRTYKKSSEDNLMISNSCIGRGIYVYDLPTKFNRDMISNCKTVDWVPFCNFLSNNAFGDSVSDLGDRWFNTHQFSLEPIFHDRILKHPCRVYNPDEAELFYVPFYAGIDELRWRFNRTISNEIRDEMILELVEWLDKQKWWKLRLGRDHVFVIGKITWDFRRYRENQKWGNRFLDLEQMQNPMKLLIERNPWEINEVGVPYPSFFHPRTDKDISIWQRKVIHMKRKHLVSFAGAPRLRNSKSIRSVLINQCNASTSCEFFHCKLDGRRCHHPTPLTKLFMESEFCLQPAGDSATRKSFFDAMVAGCIPVVFSRYTAYYQYPWHLPGPEDWSKFSVFIDQEDVRSLRTNVVEKLERISPGKREAMRRYIVRQLLPGFVYADPKGKLEKFRDAFVVSINALLQRVKNLPRRES